MKDTETRPIIAIIVRDPWGKDPDTICSALADRSLYDRIRPVVIGDHWTLMEAAGRYNRSIGLQTPKEAVEKGLRALKGRCPANGIYMGGMIDVVDMHITKKASVPSNALAKEAAELYIDHAKAIEMAGETDLSMLCPDSPPELSDALNTAAENFRSAGYTDTRYEEE